MLMTREDHFKWDDHLRYRMSRSRPRIHSSSDVPGAEQMTNALGLNIFFVAYFSKQIAQYTGTLTTYMWWPKH